MPREGVPYPSREICSLKCQIDALQRQINELMKSINGVEGDGQGNVSLISGDPAVVINNDAAHNQIEIALDSSELPAADVSSVNTKTGAVVLEASDIMAQSYNKNVERVLDDIYIFAAQNRTAINSEIYRSTNADSALQTNFNALQASIPGEAAQAVANDPTIAQLVAADAQNMKLTGAQTVGGTKTFSSSPIVPTPPAGSTDGSAANTNWISQTGDSSPNNLVHKSGNETITGTKNFEILKGSVFMAQNMNINNRTYKFAIASSRAYYKYGAVFLIVQLRDEIYLVKLQSGSSLPIHTPTVTNLSTSTQVNTANLDWHLGYIEDDTTIYATMRGPASNRICAVIFLGGHSGGSGGLRLTSITPEITTETPTEFW